MRWERTPARRPGFIWVPGYWAWDPWLWDYTWVPGRWIAARAGRRWRNGSWVLRGGNWVWLPGVWY